MCNRCDFPVCAQISFRARITGYGPTHFMHPTCPSLRGYRCVRYGAHVHTPVCGGLESPVILEPYPSRGQAVSYSQIRKKIRRQKGESATDLSLIKSHCYWSIIHTFFSDKWLSIGHVSQTRMVILKYAVTYSLHRHADLPEFLQCFK